MALSLEKIETMMLQHEDPVVTAGDLAANAADVTRRHVLDQLRLLEKNGDVESKEIGARAVAWWHVDRVAPPHLPPEEHPDQSELDDVDVDRGEPVDDGRGDRTEADGDATISVTALNGDKTSRYDLGSEQVETDGDATIDEIIQDWRPGRSADERGKRRREGREALMWLRSTGGPATATDFGDALYDDELEPSEETWWRTWVRPALKEAVEADLVDYSHGRHEYEWMD